MRASPGGWPGTGPRPATPPRPWRRRSPAAREAGDGLAFAESLSHYERALELVEVVPDAEALLDLPRARLLHSAAEVAHLAAHPDRATELVREAIACVDPEDRHLHGWLHERLGRYLWMSADTRARWRRTNAPSSWCPPSRRPGGGPPC